MEDLQWHIDASGVKRARTDKTRARAAERAQPYRELLPVAERYEAECNRIREASGYDATKAREVAAESALIAVVRAIMEQPERTMAGVVVKAQAMAATSDLPVFAGVADGALTWGPELAASVMRLATERGRA